jgi:hypothetical protein
MADYCATCAKDIGIEPSEDGFCERCCKSFRQTAEFACKWATERDERLARISRLQNEYRQFEETCEHWSTTDHSQEDGADYRRCEWCGKEWEIDE